MFTRQNGEAFSILTVAGLAFIKLDQGHFTRHFTLPSDRVPTRYKTLDPPLQDRTFQEDIVLAFETFDADIRPQSHHHPFVAAAGMRLL